MKRREQKIMLPPSNCPLCWYGESSVKVALHLGDDHHWSQEAVEGWLQSETGEDNDD